jgi:hypothetical protein
MPMIIVSRSRRGMPIPRLSIPGLPVLRLRLPTHHRCISISSLMARSAKATSGCELSVTSGVVLLVAAPEGRAAGAGGVVVGGGGAEALFALVVADE